jgi:hypothetical protein
MVSLSGGSFDGQLAMAPPFPGALRLYRKHPKPDYEEYSELYQYDGNVVDLPEYGTLPLMLYVDSDSPICERDTQKQAMRRRAEYYATVQQARAMALGVGVCSLISAKESGS